MEILLDSERSANRRLRVSIAEFDGRKRIDVRFYYRGDDGEFHPTQKGITLEDPRDLDDVIASLQDGKEKLDNDR